MEIYYSLWQQCSIFNIFRPVAIRREAVINLIFASGLLLLVLQWHSAQWPPKKWLCSAHNLNLLCVLTSNYNLLPLGCTYIPWVFPKFRLLQCLSIGDLKEIWGSSMKCGSRHELLKIWVFHILMPHSHMTLKGLVLKENSFVNICCSNVGAYIVPSVPNINVGKLSTQRL